VPIIPTCDEDRLPLVRHVIVMDRLCSTDALYSAGNPSELEDSRNDGESLRKVTDLLNRESEQDDRCQ